MGAGSGLIATMRKVGLIEGVDASRNDHHDIKLIEARIGATPSDVDDLPLLDALHRYITGRAADAKNRKPAFEARLQEMAKQPDGTTKVIEFAGKVYKPAEFVTQKPQSNKRSVKGGRRYC